MEVRSGDRLVRKQVPMDQAWVTVELRLPEALFSWQVKIDPEVDSGVENAVVTLKGGASVVTRRLGPDGSAVFSDLLPGRYYWELSGGGGSRQVVQHGQCELVAPLQGRGVVFLP